MSKDAENKKDLDKVNRLAKFLLQVGQVIGFAREYWIIIAIGGGFLASAFTLWYNAQVEPTMNKYVTQVTTEWMRDSLGYHIDQHLSTKGGGTRGNLAKYVSENGDSLHKKDVVPVLGDLIIGEDSIKKDVARVRLEAFYARSIANLLISETFKDTINRGVALKLAPSGDVYYLDSLSIPWGASLKHSPSPSRWVYYPPYNNNKKTYCK